MDNNPGNPACLPCCSLKGLFHTFSPLFKPIPSSHSPSTLTDPTSHFMDKTEAIRQAQPHFLNTKSTRESLPSSLTWRMNHLWSYQRLPSGGAHTLLLYRMHQFCNYLLSPGSTPLGHKHTPGSPSYKAFPWPASSFSYHPISTFLFTTELLCGLSVLTKSTSFLYIPFSIHSN